MMLRSLMDFFLFCISRSEDEVGARKLERKLGLNLTLCVKN